MISGKDFQLPLDKEASSRRGTKGEEEYLVFWGKTKEENGSVRKRLVLKYAKGVVHEKDVCKQEHEGSYV